MGVAVAAVAELLGITISEAVAFAAGAAMAPALRPYIQDLENETWSLHASKPLDPMLMARAIAEGRDTKQDPKSEAKLTGIKSDRLDDMVQMMRKYPEYREAAELLHRGEITEDQFKGTLRRHGFSDEWAGHMSALLEVLLTPADLAMMRQQGFIERPRQIAESAAQGVNAERADLLFEISGLPPGIGEALQMLRRSIINASEFTQIVREGHTKTKYTDEFLALKNQVLSAAEYATLHLKGWITEAEMNAGGELTGYTPNLMHLMYLARGRPAAPGQMATAAARRIDGPQGRPVDREQFLDAIRQSDIRPEYGPMLWDARFLYPPLFQLTRLVQAGAIDADTAREWAVKDRYPPEVVNALHKYWLTLGGSTTDSHVGKAQTQLWGTLHRSYLAGDATEATVRAKLTQLGVPAGSHDAIVNLWNHERELIRQRLTPAQVKKAYAKAVVNPLTGTAWTFDDALAELLSRGWSNQDARTFLAE